MTFLQTLRGKLTIWQIGSVIVGLTLLMTLTGWMVRQSLLQQIDHHVHSVVSQAKEITLETQGEEQWRLLSNLVAGEDMVIVVNDRGMLRQLTSSDVVRFSEVEIEEIFRQSDTYGNHPTHFTFKGMRFSTTNLDQVPKVTLLVGYSITFVQQLFSKLILLAILGSLLMVLLIGLASHFLLKRYLTPLEEIASSAVAITSSQKLKTQLPDIPNDRATIEVSTIRSAYNKLLSQLNQIFDKEHAFFSDAAHTLKTPLAVIRSHLENEPGLKGEKRNTLLSLVDSASTTVNDLLLISRVETGPATDRKKLSLSQMVLELVELTSTMAEEKNLKVTANITPDLTVLGEEHLLKRALSNVFHNAVNYSDNNSVIVVTLQKRQHHAVLSITNKASSLSSEEINRVFDRFFRGKSAKKETSGSGLGLAISKAIIESMNGTIKSDQEKNMVKFTVSIPEEK